MTNKKFKKIYYNYADEPVFRERFDPKTREMMYEVYMPKLNGWIQVNKMIYFNTIHEYLLKYNLWSIDHKGNQLHNLAWQEKEYFEPVGTI